MDAQREDPGALASAEAQGAPIANDVSGALSLQLWVARLFSPISLIAAYLTLRVGMGLHLADAAETRRIYRRLTRDRTPLLICANHLTMIDSALIAWALGSPGWYFANFHALPWNVPEERNFASTALRRTLAYIYKCVPIRRGGDRATVADTLARFTHLLARGEVGLLFPEGGRSRSGRVELERAAYGVGRVVKGLPGCRVLCLYLRGEQQKTFSDLPTRGDRVHVSVTTLEPKSELKGLRGSRDIARQITARLVEMEDRHFATVESVEAVPRVQT